MRRLQIPIDHLDNVMTSNSLIDIMRIALITQEDFDKKKSDILSKM